MKQYKWSNSVVEMFMLVQTFDGNVRFLLDGI